MTPDTKNDLTKLAAQAVKNAHDTELKKALEKYVPHWFNDNSKKKKPVKGQ